MEAAQGPIRRETNAPKRIFGAFARVGMGDPKEREGGMHDPSRGGGRRRETEGCKDELKVVLQRGPRNMEVDACVW